MASKRIVLLGATGSIGENTLRVVRAHRDRLQIVGLSAHRQASALAELCREFAVPNACLSREEGPEGLERLARLPEADLVVVATTGTAGLRPTLAALEAGKDVALANKEVLVLAGPFVMEAARRSGARLLPVDSEHNALFQCLEAVPDRRQVRRLLLTASGGAFRDLSREEMASVRPDDARQHPNWRMGAKVTIDSATLANKGLEMMEARWLFDIAPERIDVVVHRQSIVHSLVELIDGSLLAQMSPPSMTFPIQHCLFYPDRVGPTLPPLDFQQRLNLDFEPPDEERFPCLRLAREALKSGKSAPIIFNAANEIAVHAFLKDRLPFLGIPELIEHCLNLLPVSDIYSLEVALQVDQNARACAQQFLTAATRS